MSSSSSASVIDGPRGGHSVGFETQPFDEAELQRRGVNTDKCVWIEVSPNRNPTRRLFGLLSAHIAEACSASSFLPSIQNPKVSLVDELLGKEKPQERVSLSAGLGVFRFEHQHEGVAHKLVAVHQRRGPVVGTDCGAATWENLVLLCECEDGERGKAALTSLCNALIAAEERTEEAEFSIYRWHVEHEYWNCMGTKRARSIESVVLPAATKDKMLADLDAFLTKDTYKFYTEHGIPYKRSYLFWGEPGAGKTSLIQAVAGKYRRNLCFMQPTDPRFTDDSLVNAIREAPQRSIIVLEDVDALFAKDRSANARMSITFSGLLNALDGIANPDGQIFVLTTNFRDSLDAALIRNGRVDLHVEFKHASGEQMHALFGQFYPAAGSADAVRFGDAVLASLGERRVNMAALQHYFIGMRGRSAEEAIRGVARIVEDLREKEEHKDTDDKAANKGTSKPEEEEDPKSPKGKGKGSKGGKGGRGGKRGGGTVNVYISAPAGGGATLSLRVTDPKTSDGGRGGCDFGSFDRRLVLFLL